ncbi:MAG: hypothetical protein AB1630_09310 [bacterium]
MSKITDYRFKEEIFVDANIFIFHFAQKVNSFLEYIDELKSSGLSV